MKKTYIKPQIIARNTRVKNYIVCASGTTPTPKIQTESASIWSNQLSKDRNEIWDSGDDEASIW